MSEFEQELSDTKRAEALDAAVPEQAVKKMRLENSMAAADSIESNLVKVQTAKLISDPARYDTELRGIRQELATAYRILYALGLNIFPYNHLTVDCGEGRFLCNRYKLAWCEVSADNLVLVDVDGNLLEGEPPVFAPAFSVHGGIHATLGDKAKVVFHTHQTAATALACVQNPADEVLPLLAKRCNQLAGHIAYDPVYNGIVNTRSEGVRLAKAMGDNHVLFMGNHGITVCSGTVAEAVHIVWQLEIASEALINSLSGQCVRNDSAEVMSPHEFFRQEAQKPECGPPGKGTRSRAWDGRGPLTPVGYIESDSERKKTKVNLAAIHQLFARMQLITDTGSSRIAAVLEKNMVLSKIDGVTWMDARASDLQECSLLDLEKNDDHANALIARLLRAKANQCPDVRTPTLMIAGPPLNAGKLAATGSCLLPIVQDTMFYHGFTHLLGDHVTLAAFSSQSVNSAAFKEIELALLSKPLMRIVIGTSLMVVFGNSPAHAFGILQRYEKGAEIQLKAMSTHKQLKFIDDDVVQQPITQSICGSTQQNNLDAQLELAKRQLKGSRDVRVNFWE